MRRRELIALIGSGVAGWPLEAHAQRPGKVWRIGALMATREDDPQTQARVAAFRQALADLGWTEGRNLKIEWRWTGGEIVRVREYAAELVRLAPRVIFATRTPTISALQPAPTATPR